MLSAMLSRPLKQLMMSCWLGWKETLHLRATEAGCS